MKVRDPQGKEHTGLNFSTNNYLGLANHPFTVEAGIEAANEFGVNSAGSPLAFGATKYFEFNPGITHNSGMKLDSSSTLLPSSSRPDGSPASDLSRP